MSKKFFPVIHCVPPEFGGTGHALANTRTAVENGADGVFLILHRQEKEALNDLIFIYDAVRKQHPDFMVGVNFLQISPHIDTEELETVSISMRSGSIPPLHPS